MPLRVFGRAVRSLEMELVELDRERVLRVAFGVREGDGAGEEAGEDEADRMVEFDGEVGIERVVCEARRCRYRF